MVLGLTACGDPLVDPQTLIGLRILGARVSSDSEPSRAHINGGEEAHVSWLIAAEKRREFNGLALWCEAEPSSIGTPPCNDPFHTAEFASDTETPLVLPFTLQKKLKDDKWVHWIGLCESGTPKWRANAQRFECSKGDPVSAVYRGNVSNDNQNPNLQDDDLTLDGKPWLGVTSEAPASCGADGVPNVFASKTAEIRFRARGNDREKLSSDEYAAATQESMTYTHVTTWPGLERPYSALEGNATSFEVAFDNEGGTPKSGGELVRFLLIGRDGRGGTDWLERWFCLKP